MGIWRCTFDRFTEEMNFALLIMASCSTVGCGGGGLSSVAPLRSRPSKRTLISPSADFVTSKFETKLEGSLHSFIRPKVCI